MVYGQLGIGKENNFCIFIFYIFSSTFFSFISSHCLSVFFKYMYILLFVCLPLSVIVYEFWLLFKI